MHDLFSMASGVRLDRDSYLADFDQHFWGIRKHGFWKLERRQVFQEPGDDSWEAFSEGNWNKALQLLEERRESLRNYYRRIDRCGFRTRRVRVVEEPLSGYLGWELRLLRLRHEYGGSVRVVGFEAVRGLEGERPLPEVVTLGTEVMYEVLYDERGILVGGVRYTDRHLIRKCRKIISGLYACGEDLNRFLDRHSCHA